VSIVTIILATVFGPLQRFLGTTGLDLQQWIICICVALSIIVASEIRKIILRRRTVAGVVPAEGPAPIPR
jgi:Ca2+-transporting ATPase